MLDRLSLTDFTPHLGATYVMTLPDGRELALTLRSARALGASPLGDGTRAPFSLELVAQTAGQLSQRTYPVRFPDGEMHEIFLVPIGVTAEGAMRLEAIFT